MDEFTSIFAWAIILGGFAGGYLIVSFFADRMKTTLPYNKDDRPNFEGVRMRSTVNEQDSKIAAEEQMYAEVLGLRHPIAPSDVKSAYQHLLAKYHPDKVSQLGEEFSRIAQKKTQEIMQAYQYFQRKYGIT